VGWKGSLVEAPLAIASRILAPWGPLPSAPREILVIRPNDLGDLLTTTPALAALRTRFPSSRIVAAVGSWGRAILGNNPNVDEIATLDAPWNNKFVADQSWSAAAHFLRSSSQVLALRTRGGFDTGIDVLGSHVGAVLMMRLGVRYRVGVRGYRGGWSACQRSIHFSDRVHVARAALDQVALLGATDAPAPVPQLFLSEEERRGAEERWRARTPNVARILVGAGGGLDAKRWPDEIMGDALLLLMQRAAAKSSTGDVLIVGGAGDRERGERIAARAGNGVRSLCGETSLRQLFALAASADVVLTNASMLFHAAAAFSKPTVVVLGGMNADREAHDRLWGYPTPYRSVAPQDESERASGWPRVDAVVDAISESLASR
jgi:ADP-heptose:LPS heptosyltransferase